jgi:protein-S-isoprenylcysteine O-methyltransferase Ste14
MLLLQRLSPEESVEFILLAVLWILFCVMHSALISITFTEFVRRNSERLYRFRRLLFNIISIATLIPLVLYSSSVRQMPFFIWDGILIPVKYFFILLGILLFILGSKHYNAGAFTGLYQIRGEANHHLMNKTGIIDKTGILGIIRHPFYAGVLLLIWSRDLDITNLIVNIILTVYILAGTLIEERKLMIEFGNSYSIYKKEVSMIFPLKYIKLKLKRH